MSKPSDSQPPDEECPSPGRKPSGGREPSDGREPLHIVDGPDGPILATGRRTLVSLGPICMLETERFVTVINELGKRTVIAKPAPAVTHPVTTRPATRDFDTERFVIETERFVVVFNELGRRIVTRKPTTPRSWREWMLGRTRPN